MASLQPREGGGPSECSTAFFRAKDQALRFLAYRARSEAEVRRRLSRKYSVRVVKEVIEALRRQDLLNDLEFAQQWRADRERFRPRANRLVRQELLAFGIPDEVVEESLADFDDEANVCRAADTIARRLAPRTTDWEEFQRELAAHLRRRGFASGLVFETVKNVLEQLRADPLHGESDSDEHEDQLP